MVRVAGREWPLVGMRMAALGMLAATVALHAGTQNGTKGSLVLVLLGVTGAYVLAILLAEPRTLLRQNRIVILALLLLSLGWLSALQPQSVYDRISRTFLPLVEAPIWSRGSVDGKLSQASMLSTTALLGALLIGWDLGRSIAWRKALLVTVAALGVGVTLLGLAQKAGGDVGNYWGGRKLPTTVFGPFWYHGNAGAFLNFCWPIAAAGTVIASRQRRESGVGPQLRLAGWVLALLTLMVGVWINISKGAQAIFIVQAVVLGGIWWVHWRRAYSVVGLLRASHLVGGMVFATALTVLLAWLGVENGLDRWQHLTERDFDDVRWEMVKFCLPYVIEAGPLGYGPGTFSAVFVVLSAGSAEAPHGYWLHAHNDYLQMLLEWGWLGTLLWLALGGSLLTLASRGLLACIRRGNLALILCQGALVCGLGGAAVHAAVDFPMQIFAIQLVAAVFAGAAAGGGSAVPPEKNGWRRKRKLNG